VNGPTWAEVALRAIDMVQLLGLAWLAQQVRANGRSLEEINNRSKRRRRTDENATEPGQ
jgi:hypothetical protein